MMSNAERSPKKSIEHIHIVGAGVWGKTLARLVAGNGYRVTLVARDEAAAERIRRQLALDQDLKSDIPDNEFMIEHLADHSLEKADALVLALPVQEMRGALLNLHSPMADKPVLNCAKGIESSSLSRPTEIIRDITGNTANIAVLSGPNLATEIESGKPTSTVIASDEPAIARFFAGFFHSSTFRVYLSRDVIGVELGGALKNIIAIGAGIADGIDAGDNAKAAFMTRGLAEIARLGVACGADPMTFAGLSGMGDLMATCASLLSRNHRVGVALASGLPLSSILAQLNQVAEGIETTRAAVELAARHRVDMPIARQLARVLFDGVDPIDAIDDLLARKQGDEWHDFPMPRGR